MSKVFMLLFLLAFQVNASVASKKSNIKVITTVFNSTVNSEPDYAKYEPMHCEPYVISECAGGDCPVESGLVVLNNGKATSRGKQIFTKACSSNIYGERKGVS